MPTFDAYLSEHPEGAPKRGGIKPEHVLQIACKQWLTVALPSEVFWTAVDHGSYFGGGAKSGLAMWARLKARGVKTGIPDLHFWHAGKYLAIELKVGSGVTDDEGKWLIGLRAQGFRAEVAYSVSEVEHWLRDAGFPVQQSAAGIDARLPLRKKPVHKRASKPRAERATAAQIARAHKAGVWRP